MTQAANLASLGSIGVSPGFKNRIINGGMQIWQRGTSVAVSGDAYTAADRWKSGGQPWTGAQSADVPTGAPSPYSLQITSASGSYGTFTHRIESVNCADLVGKDITLSFWAKNVSGLNNYYMQIGHATTENSFASSVTSMLSGTYTINTGVWTKYTFTIPNAPAGIANGIQINSYNDSTGASVNKFTMFQLEVGAQATNFEVRSYGTELALCQRYYLTSGGGFSLSVDIEDASFPSVQFPVEMRASPTVTVYAASDATINAMSRYAGTKCTVSSVGATTRGMSIIQHNSESAGRAWGFQYIAQVEL
jgi:hypothetical protein